MPEPQENVASFAAVPLRWVGPARITGPVVDEEVWIPLATYETPLWPSVGRGAKVSRLCGGVRAVVLDERMTRSVLLEASSAEEAARTVAELRQRKSELAAAAEAGSRHARFLDFHTQIVGNLIFLRLEMQTGDAAGHNMLTLAAERLTTWLLEQYRSLRYVSVSSNYCTDKKPSAVNGILGRGRAVVAEAVVPGHVCAEVLRATPSALAALNQRKNLLGTLVAGSVRAGNAHFANMLLAFYLATGQDAANIVEGSQGFTWAEVRSGASPERSAEDLYFSVTVPHLIVGTVGSGKNLDFVRANLERLGCLAERPPGENARRLAVVAAAAVWCGELSLLAALTQRGELARAHLRLERGRHA